MKRPRRTEPSCVSRRLLSPPPLLLPLLLAALLPLSGAAGAPLPPSSAAPSDRSPPPLPAQPRTSPARSHQAARLEKRLMTVMLSGKAGAAWPAVASSSRWHLRALPRHGLEPRQLGSGPLRQIPWTTALRRRRHAGARPHHAQLMRVGCALGTCQVQNLSHRLWQLQGQSGRQDSSPMNPNSPHSYG